MEKYLFIFWGLVLGLSSCNKNGDELQGHEGIAVTLKAEILPMDDSGKTSWINDDAIGLYQFRANTTFAENKINNLKCGVNTDGNVMIPGNNIYLSGDRSYDIRAYYPYTEALDGYNMNVSVADQTLDLMYSDNLSGVNIEQINENNTMSFKHAFSKLKFDLTPGEGLTESDLKGISISLSGSYTEGVFSISNQSLNSLSKPSDIQLGIDEEKALASCILIPQELPSMVLNFKLANGVEFQWKNTQPVNISSGKVYGFNAVVGSSNVEITVGGIIDWEGKDSTPEQGIATPNTQRKYQIGDLYPDDENPVGIVFEISDMGKHGKIVSLTEIQNRWGAIKSEYDDGIFNAKDEDCGWLMTKALTKKRMYDNNWSSDYFIFDKLLDEFNDGNSDGDWYCPAIIELRVLYAAMSGLNYDDIKENWQYSEPMPNNENYTDKRISFSDKIVSAGGTAFTFTGRLWGSTEISKDYAYALELSTGKLLSDKNKYDTWGRLRPIKQF